MSEQDNHIEDLFKKAKNSPPVMPLSEVKDLLKNPKAGRYKSSRRWMYFSLSAVVLLGFVGWYLYSGESRGEGEELVVTTPTVVEGNKENQANVSETENAKSSSKTVTEPMNENVQKPAATKSTIAQVGKEVLVKEKSDTINSSGKVTKASEAATFYIVEESEIMIPWFANEESLKMYQNKLQTSGITLQIKDIVYNNKDMGRPYISEMKVDIMIDDSLYKSVQLKDFKEFRISWATYNTGEVRIKSVKMLDKNYMSRKL